MIPATSSSEVSGGTKASTPTSSRTEPMTPSTWELTSRPTPRTRMQMNVVVMAVMLIRRFRRMFLRASRRKKPRLNLICISPPHLVAYHAAVFEGDDPLAHHVHHLLVVGRDEHGGADAVDAVQKLHDAHARVGVEVAGRLVGDEYRRLRDKGPGDRDALLLPAGELIRILVQLPREPHQVEYLGHLRADGAAPLARDLHRVGDVLGRGLVREQLEVLEDAPNVAPVAGYPSPGDRGEPRAVHVDGPRRGLYLLQEQAHQRGLAGAARPDKKDELPGIYLQVHLLQRDGVLAVDLGDVIESDHYLSRCGSPDDIRPRTAGHVVRDPLQGLHRQTIATKADVINWSLLQGDVLQRSRDDESAIPDFDAGYLRAVRQLPERVREVGPREQLIRELLRNLFPERRHSPRHESEFAITQDHITHHRDRDLDAEHRNLRSHDHLTFLQLDVAHRHVRLRPRQPRNFLLGDLC